MQKKIILASLAILGSIQLSAYTYEVSPLIGKNFTENGSLVDDSTAFGIRINKYISEDNAIMFGYTRINGADYKSSSITKNVKSMRGCPVDPCKVDPCKPVVVDPCKPVVNKCESTWDHCSDTTGSNTGNNTGGGSTPGNSGNSAGGGSNSGNSGNNAGGSVDTGTGSNSGDTNTDAGTGTDIKQPDIKVLGNNAKDTDINRFYINGLHNIKTKYSRLVPYVYGGFGYEDVENEFADNKSQGFFNAGGGLKFRVNDRFNLVSDIQGIKKFTSHDLDILGSLGVSFLFGKTLQPEPEALVASGLEDIQPAAPKRNITIVKVESQPIAAAPIVEDTISTAPTGEYYVQIAAGFKTDMETGCKHTKDLRDAGIDYDIKYDTIKGKNVARVVVGPFMTKAEATSHLAELRKFSKDAFVKRIKN